MDAAAAHDWLNPALLPVLRLHLVPLLPARDATRLACTCKTLRSLVLSCPDMWRATARAALHQSHPALSSNTVPPLLAGLGVHQRRQQNVQAGTCCMADVNGTSAPQHSATQYLQSPCGKFLASYDWQGLCVRSCSLDLAAAAISDARM